MNQLTVRKANLEDMSLLLAFIKELADYEKLADQVVATTDLLNKWIFDEHVVQAIFAMEDGKEVGYALFFYNFSTFLGRAGIYIEDIYVRKEHRGKGLGKAMLREIARIAEEKGCGRMEWVCLNWNKPSIDFYTSLNAIPMSDWTTFRLTGDDIHALTE